MVYGKFYMLLNDGTKRQVAKDICEILPNKFISIFSEAFVVKPVNLVYFSILVVSWVRLMWVPLSMVILSLYLTFKQSIKEKVSTD
jgi:hypothetical protein